ncbi:MAG TPA: hypothetical protein VFZ34_32925 [Blastocatellia bacterium]|nr:hypothetical protein [Blastocatellia bacterium]
MSQQTSRKTGVKSSAQKMANSRHGTQPHPASHAEPGAFGKEPSGQISTGRQQETIKATKRQRNNKADDEIM